MIAVESMTEIDRVKGQLLDEFEAGSVPDIADYVRRYPEHRQELLDFWVILGSSDRVSDLNASQADNALTEGESEIVRDLCLAVSLGPEWLEHSDEAGDRAVATVGAELRRLRAIDYEYGGTANRSWQRIVVYAWLASQTVDENGLVSRLELQKLAYLLEAAMSLGVFTSHRKHRLGPYDPSATYRDAEPKCISKGYLVASGQYEFKIGPKIDEALEYSGRYLREPAVAETFLRVLRTQTLDKWDLETLATVHAIAHAQLKGQTASTENVRAALAADPTWKKKLERPNFAPARVSKALDLLARLRLLEVKG